MGLGDTLGHVEQSAWSHGPRWELAVSLSLLITKRLELFVRSLNAVTNRLQ